MRTAEITLQDDLINTLNEFQKEGNFSKNIRYRWLTEVNSLRKMEKSRNKYYKIWASKTIDYLCTYCYETGKECIIKGKYELAINIYKLGIILLPESKYFYQQLMKVKAYNHDKRYLYEFQEDASNIA